MKKVFFIAGVSALLLGSCTSTKLATTTDDVYASPKEEKLQRERLAAERKKQQEAEEKKRQEELAAQKAKDDNNPYYKDPSYNSDDYYDYAYASRMRRFNNNSIGLGYYDNWYTNNYWYSGNPAMYGVSIYSSYNYWGNNYGYGGYGYNHPYGTCGNGFSMGYGSPYNYGYNPYGYGYGSYGYSPYGYYNPYAYNPYSYGYNPYGYGYNSYPYGNGNWGYFNSFDNNSLYSKATYAPRTSHDGGNGLRTSFPNKSADDYAAKYIQSVNASQQIQPKFIEVSKGGTHEFSHNTSSGMQDNSYNTGKPSYPSNGNYNNHPGYSGVGGNVDANSVQPQVIQPGSNHGHYGIQEGSSAQMGQPQVAQPNSGRGKPSTEVGGTLQMGQPQNNTYDFPKNNSYNAPTYQAPSGGVRGGNAGGGGYRPR